MFNSFQDMPVWKEALSLAKDVFVLTEKLPRKEDYGLTSQLRRSALSVSANLAEGFGRKHSKDKIRFYYQSRGSLAETKNALIYGKEVDYFSSKSVEPLLTRIDVIWKQINCLTSSFENNLNAEYNP